MRENDFRSRSRARSGVSEREVKPLAMNRHRSRFNWKPSRLSGDTGAVYRLIIVLVGRRHAEPRRCENANVSANSANSQSGISSGNGGPDEPVSTREISFPIGESPKYRVRTTMSC